MTKNIEQALKLEIKRLRELNRNLKKENQELKSKLSQLEK